MAVPSYTTDLATVNLCTGTWIEISGAFSGSSPTENDTDNFIAGIDCTTEAVRNSGLCSMASPINTITIASGDAAFMWLFFGGMPVVDTFANGGYSAAIGSAAADYYKYTVFGNDTAPYGGWISVAIDPETTDRTQVGSPTTTTSMFGSVINLTDGIAKGNPFANDFQRHGRSLIVTAGDITNSATFVESANANDANDNTFTGDTTNASAVVTTIGDTSALYPGAPLSGTGIPASTFVSTVDSGTQITMTNNATATGTTVTITSQPYNRWGLFAEINGGYSQKGLFQMGSSGTAVYFNDSNRNIVIEDTIHCTSGFNEFEILNTSSTVLWTGIQISALGTIAPGLFNVTDNATVTLTGCTFNDMGAFIFNDGTNPNVVNSTTFRRCGQVTQGGADFDICVFEKSTAAISLLVDNLTAISNGDFVSDGSNHAMELTSAHAAGSYTLSNTIFTDYAGTDGSTGNECIYNNSGGAVTINITNGGDTPTIRNGAGATTTVNNAVDVDITVKDANGTAIVGARVRVEETDGTQVMNEETIAGGIATESFNYTTDTAVIIKVRDSSTGGVRYKSFSANGTITSTGLTVAVTLVEDTIVAP